MTAAMKRFGVADIFSALAFLVGPLAFISPNALVPASLLAAVTILVFGPRGEIRRALPRPAMWALGGLLALGAVSALWSVIPADSIYKTFQLFFLFVTALVLFAAARCMSPEGIDRVGFWLALGLLIGGAFILIERATGGPLNYLLTGQPLFTPRNFLRYKRGAVIVALFLWPAAGWLWRRHGWKPAVALVAFNCAGLATIESGTVYVALCLGAAAAIVTLVVPRIAITATATALAAIVLLTPAIRFSSVENSALSASVLKEQRSYIDNSALHRLVIWQFVAGKIAERPLLGWGLDSSRAIPGGKQIVPGHGEILPLHPHNAVLQIWLELGLGGALIAAFFIGRAVLSIGSQIAAAWAQAAANGLAVTVMAVALVGFGIWQSWWVATIGLAWIMTAAVLPAAPDSSRH